VPGDRWRSDRLYRDVPRATGGLTEVLTADEQAAVLRSRLPVRRLREADDRLNA
jgi:hypothetical protein